MDYLNLQTNKTNYNCTTASLIAAVSLISGNPYILKICTHSFKMNVAPKKKKKTVSVSQECSLHITDKTVLPNLRV